MRNVLFIVFLRSGSTFLRKNVFPVIKEHSDYQFFHTTNWFYMEKRVEYIDKIISDIRPDKIVFSYRNIDECKDSLYKQELSVGENRSFDKWVKKRFEDGKFITIKDYIDVVNYLNTIKIDVFFYDYDEMKRNDHDFVERLCNFLCVEVPVDIEYKVINKKSHLNKNIALLMGKYRKIKLFIKSVFI